MSVFKSNTSDLYEFCNKYKIKADYRFTITNLGYKCTVKVESEGAEAILSSKKAAKQEASKLILEKLIARTRDELNILKNNVNLSTSNLVNYQNGDSPKIVTIFEEKKPLPRENDILSNTETLTNIRNRCGQKRKHYIFPDILSEKPPGTPDGYNCLRQLDEKQNNRAKKSLLQNTYWSKQERVQMALKLLGCTIKTSNIKINGISLDMAEIEGVPTDMVFAGYPKNVYERIFEFLFEVL